jgi:hypothetical protein
VSFEVKSHRRPSDGRECGYVSIAGQCCRKCGFYQDDEDNGPTMFALVLWYVLACIGAAGLLLVWGYR